jgi:putative addiction module component (TIGR02574 family)
MTTLSRSEVLKLPLNDRIQLVEDIWDSIADCPDAILLTEPQKMELESRLDEYHRNPNAGSPWSLVRERIQNLK